MTDSSADRPDGFVPFPFDHGFIGANGPLYMKRDGGAFLLGFRVDEKHCNPTGNCHGGWLATFADMQLPFGARSQAGLAGRFLPTISLSVDYLAPAPKGAWVEGRTDVLKVTRNLVFAQCLATADGVPALRANGIFKIGPELGGPGSALSKLLE